MKTELTEIRNRLYDRMPSGDISAWELLQAVKLHLDELDEFIDKMDTQCVLSNVVGQSEQLPCPHCGQLEPCAGNSPETCYHPKVC